MILNNVQKEAVMTLDTAQKKIKDIQASTWWNYVLMGSAFVTLIIASVNISNYVSQIRSIKREQPEL